MAATMRKMKGVVSWDFWTITGVFVGKQHHLSDAGSCPPRPHSPLPAHRHALLALSKRRIDGAQWWIGDSGASVHGTGSMDHFYNTRPPTPEESRLIVGTGEVMQVKFIGDLDMVLHCDEEIVVTLREVSFVPGLWYELISFNIIHETEDIVLNKTGAHMLRGRVPFDKERNGN